MAKISMVAISLYQFDIKTCLKTIRNAFDSITKISKMTF